MTKKNLTNHKNEVDSNVATKERVEQPSLFKVSLLNDDFTPMEFVINLIQTYFSKSFEEATEITLNIHTYGSGVCGIYPFEIAETKASQVLMASKEAGHPLQCVLEKS